MNYNQNDKIAQITSVTLIIGVDIAKHKHVARAQDFRGLEFGKAFYFENTNSGFNHFLNWIQILVISKTGTPCTIRGSGLILYFH